MPQRINNTTQSLFMLFCVLLAAPLIAADDEPFEVLGLLMKTEASAVDTEGSMSVVRVDTPPGSGPPAHIHNKDDELFIVLEGEYRFWREDQQPVDATAGDVIFLPKGVAHQYLNIGNVSGRHYFITVPGGLDALFKEIHTGQFSIPVDREKIFELSAKYGIEYVAPLAPK